MSMLIASIVVSISHSLSVKQLLTDPQNVRIMLTLSASILFWSLRLAKQRASCILPDM